MNAKKITIYLPIEQALREIYPKSLFAGFLAKRGYRVVLLPDHLLYKFSFPSGLVIGKNHVHAKLLNRRSGGKQSFMLFEEEGAPVGGSHEDRVKVVQDRLREGASEISRVITTWGKWQTEALMKITSTPVICTGTPYIEFCKPKYSPACAELDASITNGLTDYLLINTRFVFANGVHPPYTAFTGNPAYAYKGASQRYWRQNFSCEMSMLGAFINMIERVAKTFPELNIVLRPHPSESSVFYKGLFKDFKNVTVTNAGHVISWIRNASCVLTNGCTTSVQAEVCGKPVLNYQPDFIPQGDTLVDGIGLKIANEEDVISAIGKVIKQDYGDFRVGKWRDEYETYYVGEDCLDRFAQVIDELASDHEPTELETTQFYIEKQLHNLKNRIKMLLRRPGDHSEFSNFRNYLSVAANHFGFNARISMPVENCYIVDNT